MIESTTLPCDAVPKHDDNTWSSWWNRLDLIASLQPGWNGYSATVPSPLAVANARSFLIQLRASHLIPTRVAASVVGGVGVTRRDGQRKVYVEFYNNGSAHALFSDG